MTINIDPLVVVAVIVGVLLFAAGIGWYLIWKAGEPLEHPLLRRADDHSWTDRKRDQPGSIFIGDDGIERIVPDSGQYPEPDWEEVEREAKS